MRQENIIFRLYLWRVVFTRRCIGTYFSIIVFRCVILLYEYAYVLR